MLIDIALLHWSNTAPVQAIVSHTLTTMSIEQGSQKIGPFPYFLAGLGAISATAISFYTMFLHLKNYRRPELQVYSLTSPSPLNVRARALKFILLIEANNKNIVDVSYLALPTGWVAVSWKQTGGWEEVRCKCWPGHFLCWSVGNVGKLFILAFSSPLVQGADIRDRFVR